MTIESVACRTLVRIRKKNMRILILIIYSSILILGSCNSLKKEEIKIDYQLQNQIDDYSKRLYSLKIINSEKVLDTLRTLSDNIMNDTAEYRRTPKATLYANNKAGTYFQVFENPKGTITAIVYFREGTEINVAEYYDNGQTMCLFAVTEDGIRNGYFNCYYENGEPRITGYHEMGKEIKDSTKTFKNISGIKE